MQPIKRIIRKAVPAKAVGLMEKSYRQSRGLFWQARFGFPARGIKVIAVTGTNGKSTTSAYVNEALKAGGYKTAMITTPMMEVAGHKRPRTTTRTLEKQSEVQSFFNEAKKADVDWAVLETPSHALDQDRIMGVKVDIAIVTNLTTEHLDYHKTMKNYAKAKSLLLRNYQAKWAVLNADDEWYEYFRDHSLAKIFSVGKSKISDGRLKSVKLSESGSSADLGLKDAQLKLKTGLLGEFNLYNAAQAASACLLLGIEPKKIEKGISSLKSVPGRFEPVGTGKDQKFKVLIDYAVTPDSIENSLKSLKRITTGKVRIVFGATGDRDKTKRPLMGQTAGKNADYVYLTDDETYSEDSQTIIDAVYEGIKKAKATKKTQVIPDREEAIKQAIEDAKSGDIVLITGLGHETTRNMASKLVPWSDKQIAEKYIKRHQ
ncbi:MAG TPA: UDP-N-acetylmuramoyl-L-alanyl-D-glutamate--2,6-diaminopimelate ligase [Candidatus Saccharimonadales bacterium]|nr:UDP-N-acetylmuramoyl-L-alanyl-D-glutamate--2,6-diaminopimelate ligase [Candidatus Saccharimonadales bacterium]